MGLKGINELPVRSFNPITNCESHLTETTYTDFWNTLFQVLGVNNTDEYPHVQASAHPPTYTPVTSFFCGWITHSSATKISYPDTERGKEVDAVFQRSKELVLWKLGSGLVSKIRQGHWL